MRTAARVAVVLLAAVAIFAAGFTVSRFVPHYIDVGGRLHRVSPNGRVEVWLFNRWEDFAARRGEAERQRAEAHAQAEAEAEAQAKQAKQEQLIEQARRRLMELQARQRLFPGAELDWNLDIDGDGVFTDAERAAWASLLQEAEQAQQSHGPPPEG